MLLAPFRNRAGRTPARAHVDKVRAILANICQDSTSVEGPEATAALMNWTLALAQPPEETQRRIRTAATHVAGAMKLHKAVFYERSAYGELLGESLEVPDQFCLQSFIPQTGANNVPAAGVDTVDMASEMCAPTTGPFGVCKSNPLVLNGIELLSLTGTEVKLEQVVCGITSKSADAIAGNNVDKHYAAPTAAFQKAACKATADHLPIARLGRIVVIDGGH